MWMLSKENAIIKPKHQIQSKKFIFTVRWNPTGFYVVDRVPNDTKTNSAYFVINLLTPLQQAIFPQRRALHQKRLVIHLDNCSIHTSRASREWLKEHDMLRIPQPPYSLDLAPSDFYLFPIVKERLERTQVAEKDQFFESLQGILRSIDQGELNKLFQAWVVRVQEISEGNGDYVECSTSFICKFCASSSDGPDAYTFLPDDNRQK
jgi:histone-lysine N-methyltransferase SETMAR